MDNSCRVGCDICGSVAALLTAGIVHAQDNGVIMYPENGRAVVAIFSATDLEMDDITWSQSGTDAGDFAIDPESGELKFMTSPNYEAAADDDTDDVNEITVTATDDGTGTLMSAKELMVKVTDVEERATIELSTRQPVVGQSLTATLRNADEVASGVRWTWEKKEGETWVDDTGTTTSATTPNYSSTYTPVQNEIKDELRVGVEYIDTDDDNQTVAAVAFEQAVTASAGGTNESPRFAEGTTATRMIAENAAAGTAVGAPVTATDDHRTALTYQLSTSTEFEIDSRTGQNLREGAELNYDVEAPTDRTYTLTFTATDPDGGTAGTSTVAVTVTDVAEAPEVTGPATKMVTEGTTEVGTYRGTDEADDANRSDLGRGRRSSVRAYLYQHRGRRGELHSRFQYSPWL